MKCRKMLSFFAVFFITFVTTLFTKGVQAAETPQVSTELLSVKYQTHVQNIGWQSFSYDGQLSGTSGRAFRLEGIKIQLDNPSENVKIKYQTHVQNVGWQDWVSDGSLSGTSGQALRLEGIRIKLEGAPIEYHVQYQVHVQNIGWQDWVMDGEMAGTSGQALRLEGIRIRIVKDGTSLTGDSGIKYETHVEAEGWQEPVYDGMLSGTQGKAARVEGIKLSLQNPIAGMKLKYQTYVQNIGWQDWVDDGQVAGTSGKSLRLEGIKIKLEGAPADYHVIYQTHIQNIGWQGWVSDGQLAGTEGQGLRLEAIRVQIINASGEPIITLDSPKLDTTMSKNININGWSIDSVGVAGVDVYLDNNIIDKAQISFSRPDIGKAYPFYIGSDKSGFKYTLDTTKLMDGIHSVIVESKGINNRKVKKTFTFKKAGTNITIVPRLAIDIGHNAKYDSGAIGIRKEDELTLEVGNRVIAKLKALGYEVINCSPSNTSSLLDSLSQRTNKANAAQADLFVSIHFNAGGGKGSEAFVVSNYIKSRAERVLSNLSAIGYVNRGVKYDQRGLYVLKNTDMPAMLIECAFIDSEEDMQRYNAENIANAIVNGIINQ